MLGVRVLSRDSRQDRRIFRNIRNLTLGTFIARLFGLLREMTLAASFGADAAMDAFIVAFRLPSLFRRILGEDMVEKAFMPIFKAALTRGETERAGRTASALFNAMVLSLLGAMSLFYIAAPLAVRAIGPGLGPETYETALKMSYILLPFMVVIGMAAYVGGILNFFEQNLAYSLAPVALSLSVIIGIGVFRSRIGALILPIAFLAGGVLQFLVQLPSLLRSDLRRQGLQYRATLRFPQGELRTAGRESWYIFLQSLSLKTIELVDTAVASFFLRGGISALWFSYRLVQLPHALIGLAVSRAVAPMLTEKGAKEDMQAFQQAVLAGLRYNFLLLVPMTTFIVILREPLVRLVYQRGAFSPGATEITALALLCYSLGLLGMGGYALLSRAFAVLHKNRTPAYLSMLGLIVNIGLDIALVQTPLGFAGVALASSLTIFIQFLLLVYLMDRLLSPYGERISIDSLSRPFSIVCANSLIMGGLLLALLPLLSSFSNNWFSGGLEALFLLAVSGVVGMSSYLVLSYFFPIEETTVLFQSLRRSLHARRS